MNEIQPLIIVFPNKKYTLKTSCRPECSFCTFIPTSSLLKASTRSYLYPPIFFRIDETNRQRLISLQIRIEIVKRCGRNMIEKKEGPGLSWPSRTLQRLENIFPNKIPRDGVNVESIMICSRHKRVSDQRMAQWDTLLALARMKGKYVTVPVAFGRVDPTKM